MDCGSVGEDVPVTAKPVVDGYAILDGSPATGRTARVYKAVSLTDGAMVAIKVLTASVEQSEFLEEAFRRETQSLTELRHPSIVAMRGSGVTSTGDRYLVLDWMESDLVRWKTAQRGFEWGEFWQTIGRPLVSAVAHAHSRNIGHRDLAPRNILFSPDGRLVVADFGIAKIRRFMRTDMTLRQFVSPPFSPPEADDGAATLGRDVYSLAAIFCWCASPSSLETYGSVEAFADGSDAFPPAVRAVLLQALSRDPDERPRLAEELLDRLEAGTASTAARAGGLSCLLAIGHVQMSRICRDFELSDRAATESAILDDLGSVCAIEPKLGPDGEQGTAFGDLVLYGLTRTYHVRPDDTHRDRLTILSVIQRPSGWLEARRENSVTPRVDFRFLPRGREPDQRSLLQIQQIIDDFVHERAEDEANAENRLLDTWSRILQARQELELGRERPIRYHSHAVEGRRVVFRTVGTIPDGAVLEKRQVKLHDGTFLTGHIEDIDGQEATFLVATGDVGQLRGAGEISVNVYAASEALRKQQRALDAFRQREVARAHMADVLLDPGLAVPSTPAEPVRWFQQELDADKQEAVAAALGSPDVLITRGPPGTGKTTFIAELIMQELARNPAARILLASQTHVAIDNAVERVAELRMQAGLDFEIVRIGTNDERISEDVEPQRLHRRLQAWTDQVSARVSAYAEAKAAERNVDRTTVLVGMALEQLVICDDDALRTSDLIGIQQDELERLPRRRQEGNPGLDLDVAGNVAARRLELAQLRERKRAAEAESNRLRDQLGALGRPDMASLRGSELRTAVERFMDQSDAAHQLRPLIDLGADWMARFGRQDHFEGPFLSTVQVVAGTCLGVLGSKSSVDLRFDLCIVDEASKATATEMLVPLARASRWVLVGDSKQLPPFQDGAMRKEAFLKDHDLRREDVEESLFGYLERMLPAANVISLTSQRRMVQPINDLIQACFYPDHELVCRRDKPRHRFSPALKHAVTWIDTTRSPRRGETIPESRAGCFNKYECELVNTLLRRLNKQFAKRDPERLQGRITAAVITGYSEQVKMLERTLRPRSPNWTHIDIMLNTVDAFQGRQADMVVYSVSRSNVFNYLGFLDQPPRLNVALSRGKDALVIVGDRDFCRSVTGENPFQDVLRWIGKADGCNVEHAE